MQAAGTPFADGRVPLSAAIDRWVVELDRLSHANPLRFPDPLERTFREDYFERSLSINRSAWTGGLLLWCAFGVVDIWATPSSLGSVWFLRFGIGALAVAAVLIASFTPAYRRLMQPVGALVVALVGVLICTMELILRPSEPGYELYLFGNVLVLFFGYAAPRLRFWYATVAGWAIVAVTVVVGFDHHVFTDRHSVVNFAIEEAFVVFANILGMLAAFSIETGLRRSYLQQLRVQREQDRSETLLLNILPAPVAERLKEGGTVVQAFDDVTVLFVDIVGFTPFSTELEPRELVAFLNDTFSMFDRIAEREGLEKIKTMGDSYMAVCGMPIRRVRHADRAAEMALEVRDGFSRLCRERGLSLELRIGLNSGPVVAGVIGLHKFSYDLWGDTVNTASRMESHGVPGGIQVTEATRTRLEDRYVFEGPTTVDVKGIGEMVVYSLVGRNRRPAVPDIQQVP